ncbi:MAG: hypothetical protein JKY48_15070 [Flavobacteriales bacterium]|nr:hypothetical protein [Flavobacteriales bacterium]
MSVETQTERLRKRIVEHIISGFKTAEQAIIFGNTVHKLVEDRAGNTKFNQYIGAPNTSMAITELWQDDTYLKTTFLELQGQATAMFICKKMREAIKNYKAVHGIVLEIKDESIKEKPQPQFIGN